MSLLILSFASISHREERMSNRTAIFSSFSDSSSAPFLGYHATEFTISPTVDSRATLADSCMHHLDKQISILFQPIPSQTISFHSIRFRAMESLTLQLEQQRARLLRSHSLEFQNPSVYAASYNDTNNNNNNIMDSPGSSSQYCESSTCPYDPSSPYPALYYVESPSTIVNLSSVDFHHNTDDDRNPNPSSPGYSLHDQPPLSRSASFLSRSWVSEPVSLMDVTARLHSWCKLQPSSQAKLSSSSCKWDTVVLDEEMTGVEGWFNLGIKRLSSRCRDRMESLAVFMCMMVLLTTLLLGISTSVYWIFCHPKAPITTLKVINSTLLLIGNLNYHSFFIIIFVHESERSQIETFPYDDLKLLDGNWSSLYNIHFYWFWRLDALLSHKEE